MAVTGERRDLVSFSRMQRCDVRLGARPSNPVELLDETPRMPEQIRDGQRSRSPTDLSSDHSPCIEVAPRVAAEVCGIASSAILGAGMRTR